MSYSLHIKRDIPIPLETWLSAAQANANIRLDESDSSATNPSTGEKIVIPGRPGEAALCLHGEWVKVFRWRQGKISFKAPVSTSRRDPVMAEAFALAAALSAEIRGDEGEVYDGSC